MELLEPEATQFGGLISMLKPPLSTANDFQKSSLLKQISAPSQTTLFALSQYQTLSVQAHLAPIFRLLGVEQDLMDFVAAFSLSSCDFFDSSSLKCFFLKTSRGCSAAAPIQVQDMQLELFSDTALGDGASPKKHVRARNQLRNSIRARISSGYSASLAHWGMTVVGRSETETDGFPKTGPESSLLVVTGNIQCCKIEPGRPTLQDCLDSNGIAVNSANQEPIDDSFTLRANSCRSGNQKHPTLVVQDVQRCRHKSDSLHLNSGLSLPTSGVFKGCPIYAETPLDQHSDGDLASHRYLPPFDRVYDDLPPSFKASRSFAVMYRSASGSRIYTEEAPTLRSLANTGGKHQGGSGAWKVVEYKGEEYAVVVGLPDECSTLAATEAYIKSGSRPRRVKDGRASLIPMAYRRQRPLSATEFERLMGWPVGCTEKGITRSGKEINISKTQRQKMLGNGIIPHEIQDICLSLKPFLESSYHQLEALEPGEELST